MNNLYGVLFRLKQPADVEAMNSRIQQAVEQYTDPHLGDDVVTEYSVLPIHKVYRSYPDSTRRLVILGVLGFSIFFVSILNYVLRAVAAMSRRAKLVGVHKCSGADGWHILSSPCSSGRRRCWWRPPSPAAHCSCGCCAGRWRNCWAAAWPTSSRGRRSTCRPGRCCCSSSWRAWCQGASMPASL